MIWSAVSRAFAEQASGQVRVLSGAISPHSYFARVELPTLLNNKAVTGVDYVKLAPSIRFRDPSVID